MLATLSDRTITMISVAARTMWARDALPDDVYARVAEKLAEVAGEDPVAAWTIEEGASALNGGRPFAEGHPSPGHPSPHQGGPI